MEELPKIRVEFYFMGDTFSISDVTKEMELTPALAREKSDFPIKEIAQTIWMIRTDKESCKVVSWQFEKLKKNLIGKEKTIKQICHKYNIKVGFSIKVWMENGYKPEMLLTQEIIAFLASINAEVGFDLYID
jgi:hypothetical protein